MSEVIILVGNNTWLSVWEELDTLWNPGGIFCVTDSSGQEKSSRDFCRESNDSATLLRTSQTAFFFAISFSNWFLRLERRSFLDCQFPPNRTVGDSRTKKVTDLDPIKGTGFLMTLHPFIFAIFFELTSDLCCLFPYMTLLLKKKTPMYAGPCKWSPVRSKTTA